MFRLTKKKKKKKPKKSANALKPYAMRNYAKSCAKSQLNYAS